MNQIDLTHKLQELEDVLEYHRTNILATWKQDLDHYHDYERSICRIFNRLLTIQSLQQDGAETMRRDMPEKYRELVEGWIQDASRFTSYNPLNFFVALRIYERKRREIRYKNNGVHNALYRLKRQYGEVYDAVQKRRDSFAAHVGAVTRDRNEIIENMMRLTRFGETSYLPQIEGWFQFYTMTKEQFLSLITLNHDRLYWDGVPNWTSEKIAKLPEELNFEVFQEAVFVNKIEHDQDSYLMDQFMQSMFEAMDKNKQLRDTMWDKFQETFGPIPAYHVQTDEFGRVSEVKTTKPNLKLVSTTAGGENGESQSSIIQ